MRIFFAVKSIVPVNTFSRLWDVLLLLDDLFCSFIITRQQIQREIYHIDMFSCEITKTDLIICGPYTKH